MSRPRWYRSLYWRIGLGLLAFMALMLLAQGALFLWTTERIAGSMPASSPQRLADLVASDISAALANDPRLDLEQYVDEHYGNVFQAFVVVMRDGRTVSNHDDVPQALRDQLRRDAERRWLNRPRRFPRALNTPAQGFPPGPFEPGARGRRFRGRGGPAPARGNAAPIVLDAAFVGDVLVLRGGPPFPRIARELGPTMGVVGGAVLAIGAALIAFVVFGPVRRRLRAVQNATEQLEETHRLERIIGDLVQRGDAAAAALVGDPDRLEQAIQNLAANALRHTPDGGMLVLSAERRGDAVRLSVRDSGSGIPPEQLPHIFDRFYKGDASRKAGGGSGLGLSIVKAIVERHGGTITARNDNGAVFEILIPTSSA